MTTQQLLALDLLVVVLAAVLFGAAGIMTAAQGAGARRGRARVALVCASLALVCTAGRVVIALLLAGRGWWFAADKVLVALPLAILPAVLTAVFAFPVLLRAASGRPLPDRAAAAAVLMAAAYGAAAGLLVAFVVGYPVSIWSSSAIVALVLGLSGLTYLGLHRGRRPGLTAGLLVICLLPTLTAASWALYTDVQPVVIGAGGGHGHLIAGASGGAGDSGGAAAAGAVSVAALRTPAADGTPVRSFHLTARQEQVMLPSGRAVDGWTFGSLPGPEIRVTQGDLVEVTLDNDDIADGVTLHWHGYPVPNGEDGVAGVTQDAVLPGGSFTYRFVANDTGTYWYHAHQVSSEAVARGLFGVLVVEPANPAATAIQDINAPIHTINGITMIGATDRIDRRTLPPGTSVRLRLINTDSVPQRVSVTGAPFVVTAVDGTDLHEPTPVNDQVLRIPAGGRYDVAFTMPVRTITVGVEGAASTGLLLDPRTPADPGQGAGETFRDGTDLDLLDYGTPASVPGMTDNPVDREATLVLDRQLRFLGGIPTFAQTVNGEVHPHVPPITVREGELLRLTVVNRGAETHPMHPHGHRVLVESRNGVPVTGSPVWLDTFDVQPGEVWQVLIRADNPGIWMAHCHNLEHATQGMVVHLAYEGVQSPFQLGGTAGNRPE